MKGIVFTGFFDLVEERFGLLIADELIESTDLASMGAYTSVGTYDHREILKLVHNLHKKVDIPTEDLLIEYGRYLFPMLVPMAEHIISRFSNAFDLLASLDKIIHPEVLKLYPDAELPTFDVAKHTADEMQMIYTSCRPFAYMAQGLIEGCSEYFNESFTVSLDHRDSDNFYRSLITIKRADVRRIQND